MNDISEDKIRTVVMWGAGQVGKTTALATYVCQRTPSWVDLGDEQTITTLANLVQTWNLLRQNCLPPGTGTIDRYDFRATGSRPIRFRDMKGGDAMDLNSKEHRDDLARSEALMVFVSWPGARDVANLVAAENALQLFTAGTARPMVLVITKVECFLTPEQVGLLTADPRACGDLRSGNRNGTSTSVPKQFVDLVNRFPPEAVYPISVYGYGEEHRPAHYPDEFGRLVPWKIHPLNVARPFEHIVSRLS